MSQVTFTLSLDETLEALQAAGHTCVPDFDLACEEWADDAHAFQDNWFEDNRTQGTQKLVSQIHERLTPDERCALLIALLQRVPGADLQQYVDRTTFDFIALNAEQAKEGLETEGWTVVDARDPKAAIETIIQLADSRAERKDLAQGLIDSVPQDLLPEVIGGLVIRAAK